MALTEDQPLSHYRYESSFSIPSSDASSSPTFQHWSNFILSFPCRHDQTIGAYRQGRILNGRKDGRIRFVAAISPDLASSRSTLICELLALPCCVLQISTTRLQNPNTIPAAIRVPPTVRIAWPAFPPCLRQVETSSSPTP